MPAQVMVTVVPPPDRPHAGEAHAVAPIAQSAVVAPGRIPAALEISCVVPCSATSSSRGRSSAYPLYVVAKGSALPEDDRRGLETHESVAELSHAVDSDRTPAIQEASGRYGTDAGTTVSEFQEPPL
jgi:hypothetical protein